MLWELEVDLSLPDIPTTLLYLLRPLHSALVFEGLGLAVEASTSGSTYIHGVALLPLNPKPLNPQTPKP